MEENSSNILFSIGDEKNPLNISLSKFKGARFIDLRRYYLDKKTGEVKPTTKGIALKEEEFEKVMEILSENESSLKKVLKEDLSITEKSTKQKRKEKLALKKDDRIIGECQFDEWNGPVFYQYQEEGNKNRFVFNLGRNTIKEVNDKKINAEGLLHKLLFAYEKAKTTVEVKQHKTTTSFFDDFEAAWGQYLK